MNPLDRVCAALEQRIPDRVPVMEMAIDWKVVKGLGCRNYFDAIEAGVDVVVLANGYAHRHGTLMSPEHLREFILPGLTQIVKT